MRASGTFRHYRRRLGKIVPVTRRVMGKAKHFNLKMLKVCFGPCRCFSAARR
jgi:hypothetical protein